MNLRSMFRRKYTLIRIAVSDKECMKINGKLRAAGIVHKTKIKGIYGSSTRDIGWGVSNRNMKSTCVLKTNTELMKR